MAARASAGFGPQEPAGRLDGVEGRAAGQVVGHQPDPEGPRGGRLALQAADEDLVLAGDTQGRGGAAVPERASS